MPNPWEEISLDDYEKHMSLDSVRQLQAMNAIMKEQFAAYPVDTATVLGIFGTVFCGLFTLLFMVEFIAYFF